MFGRDATGQPSSSDDTGAIIGGVVGGIIALLALACCFRALLRRGRAQAEDGERNGEATVQHYQQYQPYQDGAAAVQQYRQYQPIERFQPYHPPPPPPPPEQDGAQDVRSPELGDGAAGGDTPQGQDGALEGDNGVAGADVVRVTGDAERVHGLEPDGGVVGGNTLQEMKNDLSVVGASLDERDGSAALAAMEVEQFGLQDGAGPAPEEVVLNQSRETDGDRSNGVSA